MDRFVNQLVGVDVLIDVAGIMTVGLLDFMTMDDFTDSMYTNCWGALHMSRAVLPFMRVQGWGRMLPSAASERFHTCCLAASQDILDIYERELAKLAFLRASLSSLSACWLRTMLVAARPILQEYDASTVELALASRRIWEASS